MTELENYKKEKLIINVVKANIYAIFGLIPITIIYLIPFYLIWKEKFTIINFKNIIDTLKNGVFVSLFLIIVMIVGIILHELIHGLTWSFYAKNGFKSIKFGVMKKMLTPYCHCKEPLKVNQYFVGAIMPAIILGFIPALLSIIFGNFFLLIFGIFFTMAAMGDFMILNLIRKENSSTLVLDHPSEVGCFVYRNK